jgi:protein involved in polysaccharide export with SLBB domain
VDIAAMTHRSNILKLVKLVAMTIAGVTALVGCTRYHDYSAFVREPKPLASEQVYRLEPPDEVHISSRRVREIASHYERIRPDGMITLPLLGPIYVAGRTPEEVRAELQLLAARYYEDADINVKVTSFASKKVFVFGEVSTPGPYPYTGNNTVLGMLARAQPNRLADPGRIHVLRPSADGDLVRRMTINLDQMIKTGDTTLDVVLQEGDIIYVPANPLAATGLAVQQLLLPLQPAVATVQAPTQLYDYSSQEPYRQNTSP